MKAKNWYLILFLLQSILPFSAAQTDIDLLTSVVKQCFKQSPVKGLAVSITDKNGNQVVETLGTNLGDPLSETSQLWLGSVSKTMTALAMCRLAEQNQINLKAPINDFLKEDQKLLAGDIITIEQLLHHHSGLSQELGYKHSIEFNGDFQKCTSIAEAGTKGIYSSVNYALLGLIIENSSKKSYAQYMTEEVFLPLGMEKTFVPKAEEGSSMNGYCLAYGLPILAKQMNYGEYIVPAGYIVSTLEDVSKYSQFLLGDGTITKNGKEEIYLEKETLKSIFTPYDNTAEYGYGKSWGIGQHLGIKSYSHEGMTKISNAKITILPAEGIAINIISNTNSGPFFSVSSQATENIIAALKNKESKGKVFGEYIIRILLGLLLLKMFYDLIVYFRRWSRNSFPTKIQFRAKNMLKYFFDIFPLFILLFLPKFIHTPISMLLRIMPDIGWAILIGGLVAILHLFFRLVLPETYKGEK